MISVYFDASGQEQQALIAVGGMVSTAEQWRSFDSDWCRILIEFGLQYFRMSEFAQSVGQFRTGWKNKESKRRALLAGCGKRYLEGPSRMAIATYDVPTLANITE
jgi:hypothetical protein